jgi:PKD repeat protein
VRSRIRAATNAVFRRVRTVPSSGGVLEPVSAFSGTPLSGSSPLSVVFTDSSTNSPTSWLWEKNDGGGWVDFDGTPDAQNPTEDFDAGTWSVRLTASNAGGTDVEEKTDYVEVT